MKQKLSIFMSFMMIGMITITCGSGGDNGSANTVMPPEQACKVPAIVGLPEASANSLLQGLGLQPLKSVEHDSTVAEGTVISQDPPADTRLQPCQGYVVELVVSLGSSPEPTSIPEPTRTPGPTATPTSLPTATYTPIPPPSTFFDNFDSGIGSQWKQTNGDLIMQDGKLFSFENPAKVYAGDYEWKNFVIEFDMDNDPHTRNDIFVLAIREQTNGDRLQLSFDNDNYIHGGEANWVTVKGGSENLITKEGIRIGNDEFKVTIEVTGDIIKTFFNGEQVNLFQYPGFSKGKIYLQWLGPPGTIYIDNFSIESLN